MSFLEGVRIIDMCYGLAGAMATQVLADYGPDIVRVDRPDAGPRRVYELVRLRGRRSIILDVARQEGLTLLRRLIAGADALITEPGLDGREPLSLSYAELARDNPGLVWVRITGYGDEGPLAGYWTHDHLVAARYGVYSQPGWRPGPTFVTAPVPSLGAGLLAVQALGTALYQRQRTGRGQEVTTSLLAGALALQPGIASVASVPPAARQGAPPAGPLGSLPFSSLYECADGRWLHFGCLSPAFQEKALDALDLRARLTELGFGTPAASENHAAIIACIRERMKEKPYDEWARILEAADVPYAPAQWTEDLLDDPQVAHEGLLIELDDPTVGRMQQMGATVVIEGRPPRTVTPAPLAGQHTLEICRELGLTDDAVDALRKAGVLR